MKRFALFLVAFLSGAVLMALEIVGSRVLAPELGGSIFVWGSLIGVFLAALSMGYYVAGKLVDRFPSAWLLSGALLLAGVFVLLLPQYSQSLCAALAVRDWPRANPLIACTILFFVPGALMGTTSPFVIRLTARRINEVGQAAGSVYALSTVGSIVGTLGTAFYLLSWLGVRNILQLLGALLLATALVAAVSELLPKMKGRAQVGTAVAMLMALALVSSPASAKERILLERDSPYHHLFVTEEDGYRFLRADNIWHTQMDLKDRHGRGLPYSDYIDLAFLFNPDIKKVLVIGLGGGTIPKRFVRDYPKVSVEAVEIDPDVVKIAARYFDVHPGPRLKIHTADGRMFLRRSKDKYDLIVLDAYYADTVPFFLTTREFFQIVDDRLSPDGVFVNNTIGALSGPKSKFVGSVYRTTKETFKHVYAFKVPESGAAVMNVEIFALKSSKSVTMATLRARAKQMRNKAIKDPDLLTKVGHYLGSSISTKGVPTLTDDYAPVDALLHLW